MRLRQPRRRMLSLEEISGGRRLPAGLDWHTPDPSPEQVLESRELLRLVQASLESLPAGQRQAVLLRYLDGLSCQEIAVLLGLSTGAVRVRLHRARAELRHQLAGLASRPGMAVSKPGHVVTNALRQRRPPMIDVTLHDVIVRAETGEPQPEGLLRVDHRRIVLLKENQGDRVLPIWVGPAEGDALAIHLAGRPPAPPPGADVVTWLGEPPGGGAPAIGYETRLPLRPLTADLMARLLEATGGRIDRVAVSSLRDTVFYAVVSVTATDGESHDIDARPSDALNLAARVDAPISVADEVMAESGVDMSSLHNHLDAHSRPAPDSPEPPPGEWRSLATMEAVLERYMGAPCR